MSEPLVLLSPYDSGAGADYGSLLYSCDDAIALSVLLLWCLAKKRVARSSSRAPVAADSTSIPRRVSGGRTTEVAP